MYRYHGRNSVGDTGNASPHFFRQWGYNMSCPPHFLFTFHNILVSQQPVPLTFYNKIASMTATTRNHVESCKRKLCNEAAGASAKSRQSNRPDKRIELAMQLLRSC